MEKTELTASETLLATLVFVYRKKKDKFSADRERIHRFFCNQKKKHKEELQSFLFLEKDIFPESPLLDQAISSMEAGGLLQRLNNRPRFYEMTDKMQSAYETFVEKKINSTIVKRFAMIADEFIAALGAE